MVEVFVENALRDKSLEERAEFVKKHDGERALVLGGRNEFPNCGRLNHGSVSKGYGLIMNDGQHIFPYEDLRVIYISVDSKYLRARLGDRDII